MVLSQGPGGGLCINANNNLCICEEGCTVCSPDTRGSIFTVELSGLTSNPSVHPDDKSLIEALLNTTHDFPYPSTDCIEVLTVLDTINNPDPTYEYDYQIYIEFSLDSTQVIIRLVTTMWASYPSIPTLEGTLWWTHIFTPEEKDGSYIDCESVNWNAPYVGVLLGTPVVNNTGSDPAIITS